MKFIFNIIAHYIKYKSSSNLHQRLGPTKIKDARDSLEINQVFRAKINLLKYFFRDYAEGRITGGHYIDKIEKKNGYFICHVTGEPLTIHNI